MAFFYLLDTSQQDTGNRVYNMGTGFSPQVTARKDVILSSVTIYLSPTSLTQQFNWSIKINGYTIKTSAENVIIQPNQGSVTFTVGNIPVKTGDVVAIWVFAASGYGLNVLVNTNASGNTSTDWTSSPDQFKQVMSIDYTRTNTAPGTPGVFTSPIGDLETGDQKVFSVGSASDAEGNLSQYIWEASINNGAYTQVGLTSVPNFTYTIPTANSLKMRVKAKDAGGLESAYRESSVFVVTKPKYYWSKYNATAVTSYNEPSTWTEVGNVTDSFAGKAKSYTWDAVTGKFSLGITTWGTNDWFYSNSVAYTLSNNVLTRHMLWGGTEEGTAGRITSTLQHTKDGSKATTYVSSYKQGSLIQSGIVAVDGTYPTNGRHTDGFWYVRGSRVNQSIAPSGGFTGIENGKVYKPGEIAVISFDASTASNLSLYEVDYRYNNDAWQPLAYNNTLSRQLTITADKTKTTLQFRVRAKNTSNVYSDYVYTEVYQIQHNTAPTISLNTENNLELSAAVGQNEIVVDGFTKDSDAGNALVVKIQINDGTVRNIKSEISDGNTAIFFNKALTYSEKKIFDGATPISNDLAEGVDHKLKVWTEDGNTSSIVEERIFRVTHNRPPVISGTDNNLGTVIESPSIVYQVNDLEANAITITEKINGQVIRTFEAAADTDYTLEIPLEKWILLQLETHTLTIEATDSAGLTSVRTYTFTRTEDTIHLELKSPFETDVAATRILVTPEVYIPIGASILIEACNNAFDDEPTWEDITSMAMANRGYNFTNTEKAAEQWGINIRFTLEKGTATQEVRLEGFGGAFD